MTRAYILGKMFNKGLIPVTKSIPIVQVEEYGLNPLYLESYLLCIVQRDLIYTTRLKEIKDVADSKALIDFGLRRSPGLESTKRFSDIATKLGYTTSNMYLKHNHGDKIVGTLPHAFVQYMTVNYVTNIE